MNFVLYTDFLSAHQLPLSREIVKRLGDNDFRYVYTVDSQHQGFQIVDTEENWVIKDESVVENCDVLLVGIRPIDIMLRRSKDGKRTLYMSERWFKPPLGMLRLLHPKYLIMALKFVKILRNSSSFTYLPIGIHAARDMARLCGLMHGDLRCLFKTPELDFDRKPGGKIWFKKITQNEQIERKYCLDKMRMWGYFVEPTKYDSINVQKSTENKQKEIKILWVGRLLRWKRVDTLVRAVTEHSNLKCMDDSLPKITLDIFGAGPEEEKLKRKSHGYEELIKFYPSVPITEIRKLMHEHDVFVLTSNGYEGWGAVISEALEEGMKVIGTYEAGSSATMLTKDSLFHAGNWRSLLSLLMKPIQTKGIGDWNAESAAKFVLSKSMLQI